MSFRRTIAASVVALSLVGAPLAAQSASALSLAQAAPAGASAEGGSNFLGEYTVPLVFFAALGVLIVVMSENDDDDSISP
jgi:hypothetical protein